MKKESILLAFAMALSMFTGWYFLVHHLSAVITLAIAILAYLNFRGVRNEGDSATRWQFIKMQILLSSLLLISGWMTVKTYIA